MLVTAADIAWARRVAEAHMVDTCRIKVFRIEDRVWNEGSLSYSPGPGTVVYEGKCRVQVRSDINSNAVEAVVGEHEWTYRTNTVQLPISGSGYVTGDPNDVQADCVLELLTSPHDPSRVGRVMNLQADTKTKTHATHRRFLGKELLG